jgi:peptidoglycan hydrolase CwlO-like protein
MLLVDQRDRARARVQTLESENAELVAANQTMDQAVARQNVAIDRLRAEAATAAKAAQAQEQNAARRGAAELQAQMARAAKIVRARVPDGCSGAIAWGNAQGPERGRW